MKTNIYQIVTDKFIKSLEQGEVAWQKPWNGGNNAFVSRSTGKPYSFLNTMLLMMQGGTEGEYVTFNQVKAEGGKVKKGSKQKMVVFSTKQTFTKTIKDENGEEKQEEIEYFVLKHYYVFHISETEGLKVKYPIKVIENKLEPLEEAENIMTAYITREGIKFDNSVKDNAYYRPSQDLVAVPALSQYKIAEEYYSTNFHELVHSTGIESRCKRGLEKTVAFGSNAYSKEELVAEIGSAMITNILGIDNKKAFNNSIAYVKGWLKALKNDPKLIIFASAKAEQAVKYILNEKKP